MFRSLKIIIWITISLTLSTPLLGKSKTRIFPQMLKIISTPTPPIIWDPAQDAPEPFPWSLAKNKKIKKFTIKKIKPQPPQRILKISPKTRDLIAGERLILKLQMSNANLNSEIYWIKSGTALCNTPICSLNTREWSPGVHRVTAVFNQRDSAEFYHFDINIAFRIADLTGQIKEDPLIDNPGADYKISLGDNYVRALQGQGYKTLINNDVKIIENLTSILEEGSSLKSNSITLLQLGKSNYSEFYLFPGSAARYATNDTNLLLKEGLLRARNLGKTDLKIDTGNKVKIILKPESDIIVEVKLDNKKSTTEINCLSGLCEAEYTLKSKFEKNREIQLIEEYTLVKSKLNDKLQSILIHMRAGDHISIDLNSTKITSLRLSPHPKLQELIEDSTPQYLSQEKWDNALRGDVFSQIFPNRNISNISQETKLPTKERVKLIQDDIDHGYYFSALENTYSLPEKYKDTDEYHLLLSQIKMLLQMYKSSYAQTKQVQNKRYIYKKAYYLGLNLLLSGKHTQAEKYLDRIDVSNDPFKKPIEILYYKSINNYFLGETRKAKNLFKELIWFQKETPQTRSSELFLKRMAEEQNVSFTTTFQIFKDSNPLHVADDDTYMIDNFGLQKTPSNGTNIEFELNYNYHEDQQIQTSTKVNLRAEVFSEKSYSSLTSYQLNISNPIKINLQPKNKLGSIIYLSPFIQRVQATSLSAADVFGTTVKIRNPGWRFSPGVVYENKQFLDPEPLGENILDPITLEPAKSGERSGRTVNFGVIATLSETKRRRLDLLIKTNKHRRRYRLSSDDSFDGTYVKLNFNRKWTNTIDQDAIIDYEARVFNWAEKSRSESIGQANTTLSWSLEPLSSLFSKIEYKSKSSSVTTKSYTKYRLIMGYLYRY